jgi:hypothetical protein
MFHSPTKSTAPPTPVFPIFEKQQQQQQHKRPRTDNDTASEAEDDEMPDDRFTQILNAITTSNAGIAANNAAIRDSHTAQLAKIDELRDDVTAQVNSVKDEVAKVVMKVDKHDGAIDILRRQMNDMEQSKFDTHMEITGINKAEIEKHRADITSFAKHIIGVYVSNLSSSSIRDVFIRDTRKADFSVIVVIFSTVEQKNAVMKKKRETKDGVKIYFDDRVTTITRAIFMKAKEVAKAIGAKKASMNHGKVTITMQDDSRLKIRWFSDLERIQQVPVIAQPMQSTSA